MWQDALTSPVMSIPLLLERYSPRYTHRYTGQPSLDQPLRPINTAFMLELIIVCTKAKHTITNSNTKAVSMGRKG